MYFCIGFHLTPSMTWKSNAILFIFLSCASLAWAGDPDKKILQAVKAEVAPKMDGYLDDPVWETAPLATDFIQHEPFPMAPSSEQTEVRVVYTGLCLLGSFPALLRSRSDSDTRIRASDDTLPQ